MAGMRATHKKDGVSYKFSGDLRECIEKARKNCQKSEGRKNGYFWVGRKIRR